MRASLVTLIGIAVLWFAATRPLATDAALPAGPAPVSAELKAEIPGVDQLMVHPERPSARRNLFGYAEVASPRLVEVSFEPTPLPLPPQPVVEAQPVEEAPPHFPYRYIGRFGTTRDPIVAFAAEGDVVTVRRGDRVGVFTVRSIDVESVDVADERGRIVRVPFGS